MKTLSTLLGTGMLLLSPLLTNKTEAHDPNFYHTPTGTVSVNQRTEVYRTHHWDHDDVTARTQINITKRTVEPHVGYTTVVTHHHGCSCHSCRSHTPKVGINGWPVYYPHEPVRNTLKATGKAIALIFCPRCRRQHECNITCPGCGCSSHVHTTVIQSQPAYVPQTRTQVIVREVSPTAVHREIYYDLP